MNYLFDFVWNDESERAYKQWWEKNMKPYVNKPIELWIDESDLKDRGETGGEYDYFPKEFGLVCPSCGINPTAWTNGIDFVIPTMEDDTPINTCYSCGIRIKLRISKFDPADHLMESLDAIIFRNGDHVASEFERCRKLVREEDVALLAAWMSWCKWKQNEYTEDYWPLKSKTDTCPLCLLNYPDCSRCAPSLNMCDSRDSSPYGQTKVSKKNTPLLDALKKAVAYEIERLGDDYDPEALRKALSGETESTQLWCVIDYTGDGNDEILPAAEVTTNLQTWIKVWHGEDTTCYRIKDFDIECDTEKGNWYLTKHKEKAEAFLKKIQADKTPPEPVEIVMDEDGPSRISYDCKKCGGYFTFYREGKEEWTHSCGQSYKLRIRAKEEQLPEIIAEEDEDGNYWYRCPHCGDRYMRAPSGGKEPLGCSRLGMSYTVRRRTRFERWAEEGTELWCVRKIGSVWQEPEPAKVFDDASGFYLLDDPYPRDCYWKFQAVGKSDVAYLGESYKDAFKIACEKWYENETPLFFGTWNGERFSISKAFVRNVSIWRGEKGVHAIKSMTIKAAAKGKDLIILSPNYNRVETWLKERLTNE